jgi:hypothetical protein
MPRSRQLPRLQTLQRREVTQHCYAPVTVRTLNTTLHERAGVELEATFSPCPDAASRRGGAHGCRQETEPGIGCRQRWVGGRYERLSHHTVNGSRREAVQQKVSPSRVILRTFKVHDFLRFYLYALLLLPLFRY